jgi:hypothetical protein
MKGGADGGGCFPTGRHYPGIAHLMRVVTVGLDPAFEPSHGVLDLPLVCIDTETTGRDTEQDRVVELGCVFFREGAISERLSWLFNPGRPIPQASPPVRSDPFAPVKTDPFCTGRRPRLGGDPTLGWATGRTHGAVSDPGVPDIGRRTGRSGFGETRWRALATPGRLSTNPPEGGSGGLRSPGAPLSLFEKSGIARAGCDCVQRERGHGFGRRAATA